MDEPCIALAASPREWARTLHRHVADHGGARVRATVLCAEEAIDEAHDVFVGDDCTSFLTRRLVGELHGLGRRVLGVYDPHDPAGKGLLLDIGVDEVIARDAGAPDLVAAIQRLAAAAATERPMPRRLAGTAVSPPPRGRLIAVSGPSGGGATEVAISLAGALGHRNLRAAVVDLNTDAPGLAQRLGVAPWPNLRTAVDAVEHGVGELQDVLSGSRRLRCAVLPGLGDGEGWADVRAPEVRVVLDQLAEHAHAVLADVGGHLDALPTALGIERWGVSRAVVEAAHVVVGVGAATPAGVTRLLTWATEAAALAPDAVLHLVANRVPNGRFARAELLEEIHGGAPAGARVWTAPDDRRVSEAAWAGGPVRRGPFMKAMEQLALELNVSETAA